MRPTRRSPLLYDWVARSPQVFSAWLVRGAYSRALAWHMRGHKTIRETSEAQVLALREHMSAAEADLSVLRVATHFAGGSPVLI